MRKTPIEVGEYYHVFNRGNNKQSIFLDKSDYVRFLFLVIYFQSDTVFYNVGYYVKQFTKHSVSSISRRILERILKHRVVSLINFALMPNHFHFTLYELAEGGIARYMQKIQNAYTKYFNAKYHRVGHLFQGPYKAVRVEDNKQLLHLSAYIHRNPREIAGWKNKEHKFPWSSYQDYTDKNRWGDLLQQNIITDQIPHGKEYKHFIDASGTKLSQKELDSELMID